MVYIKQVKIKRQKYWYLFHTIRKGDKFLKKSRYLGKELPKNVEELKKQFLEEINNPKNTALVDIDRSAFRATIFLFFVPSLRRPFPNPSRVASFSILA